METRNENKNLENRIPPIHDETHQGNLPDEQPGCSLIKRSGKGKRKLWSQNFQNDINKPKVSVAEIDTVHPDFNRNNTEDKDFVKKSDSPPKSTSNSTEGRVESPVLTRRIRMCRVNNPPIYTEISDSRAVRKKKPAKKGKKTSKPNVGIEHFVELADERMRDVGPQVLDCSIVREKYEPGNTEHVTNVLLHAPPETDEITDDEIGVYKVAAKIKKKIWATKAKLHVVSDKKGNRTVSPPPGLAVETMARELQIFKEMYKEDTPPINTQDPLGNTSDKVVSDKEDATTVPLLEVDNTKFIAEQIPKRRIIKKSVLNFIHDNNQSVECKELGSKPVYDTRRQKQRTVKNTITNVSISAPNLIEDSLPTAKHAIQMDVTSTGNDLKIKSPIRRKCVSTRAESKKEAIKASLDSISVGSIFSRQSSVNNCGRNMESAYSDVDTNLVRDTLENMKEKLETTLNETNNNTSYKLINLIISTHTELLNKLKEIRTFKEDLSSRMIEHIKIELAQLDQRYEASDTDLERKLTEIAQKIVREDCRHKQALMDILSNDIDTVVDAIEKSAS